MPKLVSGFTLIELLVVISIIGTLSSVVLGSLSTARSKAIAVAGFQGGKDVLNMIVACDSEGGKVVAPNSTTNPTNQICTVSGNGYWPQAPQGWTWYQTVWVNGAENLVYMLPTGSSPYGAIHCGYYPSWSSYCGSVHVGLCRGSRTFTCTYIDANSGIWK